MPTDDGGFTNKFILEADYLPPPGKPEYYEMISTKF